VQLRSGGRPGRAEARASRRRLSQRYELEFDDWEQSFYLRGLPLMLARLEYRLLGFFVEQAGRTVPRGELLEALWGPGHTTAHEVLYKALSRLREALGPQARSMIVNRRGIGYLCRLERGEERRA
jgi:DNA-binding response OmpR family regulator